MKRFFSNIILLFCFLTISTTALRAQCGAVTTAAVLESCMEAGTTPITLAANINVTGLTITIPNGAVITVNMGAFDISWSGSPFALTNPGTTTSVTFTSNSGGIAVVKNSPAPGEITLNAFNAAGSANTAILPITLADLTVTVKNASAPEVLIAFATVTEYNNASFLVERSIDGRSFSAIGTVKGAGNSSTLQKYEFTDLRPFKGTSYYRLKQVDFNGRYSYSPLRSVVIGRSGNILLAPSPAKSTLTVQIESPLSSDAAWQVLDLTGRTVLAGTLAAENAILEVNVTDLVPGVYTLQLAGAQTNVSKQFVKQ
jgi:hypothetical protein